jgi:hypothetical protein
MTSAADGPAAHQSVIVLYEQSIRPQSNDAPRIVELAATPDHAASSMIREPGAKPPEVREPEIPAGNAPRSVPAKGTGEMRAETPRSSQYVPIEAPPATKPVVDSPPPSFSAQPVFEQPTAEIQPAPPPAETIARQPEAPTPGGPYVTSSTTLPSEPSPPANSSPAPAMSGYTPDQPGPAAVPPSPRPSALGPAADRAAQISDRGFAMAQRGMLFAGREELIKSLQLVAQALDVQEGTSTHAAALASGLAALREARDFASSTTAPGAVVNVAQTASTHRTPVLRSLPSQTEMSPVIAQQQYLAFAQSQLAIASGHQPVASQALYRLGRLQTSLAAHDDDAQALHAPHRYRLYGPTNKRTIAYD